MTLDGETTQTKVVDFYENYNFVVDDFFSFDISCELKIMFQVRIIWNKKFSNDLG